MEEAEVVSTSPVIKKGTARTMTFGEALIEATQGKRITRLEWSSNDEYGFIMDEKLSIHTKGKDNMWLVSSGDIMANDWVIIPTIN